jgi:hypothetical protein
MPLSIMHLSKETQSVLFLLILLVPSLTSALWTIWAWDSPVDWRTLDSIADLYPLDLSSISH